MLVDVRVILLVGNDMTIYIPVELETLRVCTRWLQMHQQKDGLSHYQNSTSLSALDSILETLRARVVCMGMDSMVVLFPLSNNDTQAKVQIDRTWLDSIFIIT